MRMRETREVINKSEGAVVSVSIFLDRMVVQRERKTTRVCQWDQSATCKKSRGRAYHDGYLYQRHVVIYEAKA